MTNIQSQLDQVLALKELARDIHYAIIDDGLAPIDPPGNSAMREAIERVLTPDRLSAIRAAVGGEAVAWPSVAKRVGDDWEARTALVTHSMSEAQANTWNACRAACIGAYSRATPLYASPPATATVGVGASECRWTYDTDTPTDTAWDTQCGHRHQFTSDGPVENEHKFCPYCGGELAALIGEKA